MSLINKTAGTKKLSIICTCFNGSDLNQWFL